MTTRNTIITVSALVGIAIAIFVYRHYFVTQPEKVATTSSDVRTFTKETDAVSINITYPMIPGVGEDITQANLAIQTALDKRIFDFEKEADISMGVENGFPKDIRSSVTGSPSFEEKNDRYVVVLMGMEWYIRGAAHPAHTMDVYVYDYKNKRLLSVDDLFLPGADYLPTLSRLAREDLSTQATKGDMGFNYNEEMVQDGTAPRKENFSLVAPLKDGLAIYFSEYQVAPYAAGPQQVVIPYSKLEGLFNSDLLK